MATGIETLVMSTTIFKPSRTSDDTEIYFEGTSVLDNNYEGTTILKLRTPETTIWQATENEAIFEAANITSLISKSKVETALALTYLIPAFIIAIFGNTRIIYLIWRNEKYQSPYFYIIMSYAFADTIQGLTSLPIMIFSFIQNENVEIADALCTITGILSPGMVFLSFHILTLMAFERYYYFVRPLKYPLLFTTRKLVILETLLWTFALLFSTVIHFANPRIFYTSVLQCQSPSANVIIYVQILTYLVPALVVTLFSIGKLMQLRTQHQAKVHDSSHGAGGQATTKSNKTGSSKAAIKIIALTSGLFWITYLPPALFRMLVFARGATWSQLDSFANPVLSYAFRYLNIMLFTLSSVANPFIYTYTHRPLRRHFFGKCWYKTQVGAHNEEFSNTTG